MNTSRFELFMKNGRMMCDTKTVIDVDDTVVHWAEIESIVEVVATVIAMEAQKTIVIIPIMTAAEIDIIGATEETEIAITIVDGLHRSRATTVLASKLPNWL